MFNNKLVTKCYYEEGNKDQNPFALSLNEAIKATNASLTDQTSKRSVLHSCVQRLLLKTDKGELNYEEFSDNFNEKQEKTIIPEIFFKARVFNDGFSTKFDHGKMFFYLFFC